MQKIKSEDMKIQKQFLLGAEAIAQAPAYLKTFTESREKVAFLHRLLVLAPDSPKVKRALDMALGKPAAPDSKSKAGKKKS